MDNNSGSSSSWDLEMSDMGINHFPLDLIQPPYFLGSSPSSSSLDPPPPTAAAAARPAASCFVPGDPVAAALGEEETEAAGRVGEGAVEEEDEEEETLGAMKEMMYRIAAMQPVDIDPATIKKPRRRNVRISDDPQSVAARHRRERISERIRILQRLVPGGTKMDTASMLDEAIRYVKFLKRQVQELQHSPPVPPPPPPPIQPPSLAWPAPPLLRPPLRPDSAAPTTSSSSAMGAHHGLGFSF